jgi:hypothetical protein
MAPEKQQTRKSCWDGTMEVWAAQIGWGRGGEGEDEQHWAGWGRRSSRIGRWRGGGVSGIGRGAAGLKISRSRYGKEKQEVGEEKYQEWRVE